MSGETIWEGQPQNKIRWEFKDPREAYIYAGIIAACALGFLLNWGWLMFLTAPLVPFLLILFVTRHPWRAFRRRSHTYRLTKDAAYIYRNNLLGMPITETYPITSEMKIELVERSGLTDVYFGRRVLISQTNDQGERSSYAIDAGFELIPDGREVYLKMLELQLENVSNG